MKPLLDGVKGKITVICEQFKLSSDVGIWLQSTERTSGEYGLLFQKENSAKKLKLIKNLSLLTDEKCSFLEKIYSQLWSKLRNFQNTVGIWLYLCLTFTYCTMHLSYTYTDFKMSGNYFKSCCIEPQMFQKK